MLEVESINFDQNKVSFSAMRSVILEGVAGTGKSTLFQRLIQYAGNISRDKRRWIFISEEDTFGELFAEIRKKDVSHPDHLKRLSQVMNHISAKQAEVVVLERFHISYYALGIRWELLDPFDAILAKQNFGTVLLDLNEDSFEDRCLKRIERFGENWESELINLYGSSEKVVAAFKYSQNRRREALSLSRLPSLCLNTSQSRWDDYLENILSFCLLD